MTTLFRLRMWLRQASRSTKVGAIAVVVILVAAIVAGVVATSTTSKHQQKVATGPVKANVGKAKTSSSCSATPAPVKIGVVLAAVGSGGSLNEALGLPSIAEQRADFQAVINDLNANEHRCYTLQPVFQAFNYTDPASTQSSCLEFVQDKVIAMLGGYSATSTNACPLQHKIAVFDNGQALLPSELEHSYPYYFGPNIATIYNNFARAAAQAGYFGQTSGTGKIGFVYRDCIPGRIDLLTADLAAAGVPSSRLSKFSLGCPAAFASPASLEQAVLQFKRDGVKVAISIADQDMAAMTHTAQQQGFRPQWVMPDGSIVATTLSPKSSQPDPQNFAGAYVVASSRYGEPAAKADDAATAKCNAILTKAGLKPIAQSPALYAGAACDYVWTLNFALQNAKAPVAADLAAGLQKAGPVKLAFPAGPAQWKSGTTYPIGSWRVVRFGGACACWQVPDTTFHPNF
jgi:hypothetical protein